MNSKNEKVVIYNMGKVGSSSIHKSLKQYLDDSQIYKPHYISESNINQIINILTKSKIEPHPDVFKWKDISKLLANKEQLKFIIPIRSPLKRNISAFFHNLKGYVSNKESSVNDLISAFINKYQHDLPDRWCTDDFNETLKFDLFAHPFNHKEGFSIVEKENLEILIFKSEVSNYLKEALISKFLGIPDFKLRESNIASKKEYSNQYRDFKEKFELPAELEARYKALKFLHHFYPELESTKLKVK